jgi:hypothetical protein
MTLSSLQPYPGGLLNRILTTVEKTDIGLRRAQRDLGLTMHAGAAASIKLLL